MSNEDELKAVLGEICDTCACLIAAAGLPLSDATHKTGLLGGLEKIQDMTEPYRYRGDE